MDKCRHFLYGWGGEFDIQAKTIDYHPTTPIISNHPICLPDPRSCPGIQHTLLFLCLSHVSLLSHMCGSYKTCNKMVKQKKIKNQTSATRRAVDILFYNAEKPSSN